MGNQPLEQWPATAPRGCHLPQKASSGPSLKPQTHAALSQSSQPNLCCPQIQLQATAKTMVGVVKFHHHHISPPWLGSPSGLGQPIQFGSLSFFLKVVRTWSLTFRASWFGHVWTIFLLKGPSPERRTVPCEKGRVLGAALLVLGFALAVRFTVEPALLHLMALSPADGTSVLVLALVRFAPFLCGLSFPLSLPFALRSSLSWGLFGRKTRRRSKLPSPASTTRLRRGLGCTWSRLPRA